MARVPRAGPVGGAVAACLASVSARTIERNRDVDVGRHRHAVAQGRPEAPARCGGDSRAVQVCRAAGREYVDPCWPAARVDFDPQHDLATLPASQRPGRISGGRHVHRDRCRRPGCGGVPTWPWRWLDHRPRAGCRRHRCACRRGFGVVDAGPRSVIRGHARHAHAAVDGNAGGGQGSQLAVYARRGQVPMRGNRIRLPPQHQRERQQSHRHRRARHQQRRYRASRLSATAERSGGRKAMGHGRHGAERSAGMAAILPQRSCRADAAHRHRQRARCARGPRATWRRATRRRATRDNHAPP